jgi:hypothetical protein
MLQECNLMTIFQLEELFLKETGLVAPDKATTPTEGQPPRAAREETSHLWLKKYTPAVN